MAEQYVLGVDIGTTNAKAILVSEKGRVVAASTREYPLFAPAVGHCEQRAQDWWGAVVSIIRELCADAHLARNVRGIAFSTQGGTIVPVDGAFEPIAHAIVWNDRRCEEERQEFEEQFGADFMYQCSGWRLGAGLPALQVRHMRKRQSDVFRRAAMFLSVPDYIAAKLTGKPAVDFSNAGINQFTDIRAGKHCKAILDFMGVRMEQVAKPVPSGRPIGALTDTAARELGLPAEVIVSSGAHDQYAVALGAGICEAGDAVIGTGTAWVVTALRDGADFASGFAQSISASEGKWGTMISISTGGVCLDWFRKQVAGLENTPLDYATINRYLAERYQPGSRGLIFYPYFNGASLPATRSPQVKATLLGLDLSHDRYDIAHAVMEGVGFQICWALQEMEKRQAIRRLCVAGGATKSPVWMQMLADISGRPIHFGQVTDLACVGAAILAGVGCGLFRDTAMGAQTMLQNGGGCMDPIPSNVQRYAELMETYKARVQPLKILYGEG